MDIGRMVLTEQVRESLGDRADEYDVPGIVEGFIKKYGFCDVTEICAWSFQSLIWEYPKLPQH